VSSGQEQAREALRARQGAGARYDAATAPAQDLDLARRGTAYFARILTNLSDKELYGASALRGKNRRWVVAAISLQARMIADAIACVRTDLTQLPFAYFVDPSEIALAATLPSQALRNLFAHSEVHLNVEWRDLTDKDWESSIKDSHGWMVVVHHTPRIRAYRLWRCALQLKAGARMSDLPPEIDAGGPDRNDPLPALD
jgi:maleylpyruvate isomerase